MIVELLFQDKIKYPFTTNHNFVGGSEDGFIFPGNKDRLTLDSVEIEYENLTHDEADSLITNIYSGLSGGNRLKFADKFFSGAGDFLTEEWNFDSVKIKLNLKEVK